MIVFLVRDKTISIIGVGSLGTAVVDALSRKGHQKIIATRRNQGILEGIQQKYGIDVSNDNTYAVENSEIVILSVKPYLIDEVCKEIGYSARDKLVVSLAAAKSIAEIKENLRDSRICRVMTGISVVNEIAGYTFGSQKKREDEMAVRYIFGNSAREVEEKALADRTWIACDTGLLSKEIEHKIKSLDGLSREDARIMYAATLEGIAKCLREGMTGDEIYDRVAGSGSFTGKLHDFLRERGAYDLTSECVTRTLTACRK
jgi:pyrroline-5-carboxylate reductase